MHEVDGQTMRKAAALDKLAGMLNGPSFKIITLFRSHLNDGFSVVTSGVSMNVKEPTLVELIEKL